MHLPTAPALRRSAASRCFFIDGWLHQWAVMRGFDPRIHAFATKKTLKTWMAGASPAMTKYGEIGMA